jgi:hypothetical protein
MACDWLPPPALVRLPPPAGTVSVDLITHIHRTLPTTDGWLTASFEIDAASGGLAVEHGRIASPDGLLLAESFHTRWLPDRTGEGAVA